MAGGNPMTRYARQTILPQVGPSGQEALAAARVVVVGAGGLAAPVLPLLAGAGVGHITLVDADDVALSNLHRQTLFTEADIGTPKVTAAARALTARNSACSVVAWPVILGPDTVAKLCHDATLVLDCADSFAASYVLSDHCLHAGLPLISASALGFGGYVGGFCGGAPSLRAVFPDLPDRAASCDTAGVMAPVVATIGAAQAQMALACILGLSPSPLGQLVSFDLASYRFGGFRFDTAPEPDHGFGFVAPSQIRASDWVVDLRGPDEAPTAATPTARRIILPDFLRNAPRPTHQPRAVIACRSGLRAWQAATHLASYWHGPITLLAMGEPSPLKGQTDETS
ncbi:HesA/MoeB/ThiF family protein [Sulfitobacter sp. M39]|uniref:ThiF family adenylyltransferase n=1 Tax=Sulfitobacter sp. M39 TaxID=2675334 RepID=UPI001F00979F|nr:ThiF family adenylyltransferase [Sulfitobacter sp. M39]MCF7747682.1 HesA/MoeB/ThiF family protein [Sulfitobacter sp. M39]